MLNLMYVVANIFKEFLKWKTIKYVELIFYTFYQIKIHDIFYSESCLLLWQYLPQVMQKESQTTAFTRAPVKL